MSITLPVTLVIVGLAILFLAFVAILVNGARAFKIIDQDLSSPLFDSSAPRRIGRIGRNELIGMAFMALGGLTTLIGAVIFIARLATR